MTIEDFLYEMGVFFPDINKKIVEHTSHYGERLDTIVIEEIIMPEVINLLKNDIETEKIKRLFDYFEEVCINSDAYLLNVFSITSLEILGNDRDILKKAKKYMDPTTTKLQREADLDLGRKV